MLAPVLITYPPYSPDFQWIYFGPISLIKSNLMIQMHQKTFSIEQSWKNTSPFTPEVKSMNWYLYDRDVCHEKGKEV